VRRAGFCALGSTLGALGAGLALDHARPGAGAGAVLSLLAIASCGFGAGTSLLLARQHEPGGAAPASQPTLADAIAPWREAIARRALTFHVAWAAAGGVAAAFYPIHMIANLRTGLARMALHHRTLSPASTCAASLWGPAVGPGGARPVALAFW